MLVGCVLSLCNLTGLSFLLFQCHVKNSTSHSKIKELFFTIIFFCQLFALSPYRPELSLSLAFFPALIFLKLMASPRSYSKNRSCLKWHVGHSILGVHIQRGWSTASFRSFCSPHAWTWQALQLPRLFSSGASVFSLLPLIGFQLCLLPCYSPCPTEMPILWQLVTAP